MLHLSWRVTWWRLGIPSRIQNRRTLRQGGGMGRRSGGTSKRGLVTKQAHVVGGRPRPVQQLYFRPGQAHPTPEHCCTTSRLLVATTGDLLTLGAERLPGRVQLRRALGVERLENRRAVSTAQHLNLLETFLGVRAAADGWCTCHEALHLDGNAGLPRLHAVAMAC